MVTSSVHTVPAGTEDSSLLSAVNLQWEIQSNNIVSVTFKEMVNSTVPTLMTKVENGTGIVDTHTIPAHQIQITQYQ